MLTINDIELAERVKNERAANAKTVIAADSELQASL